MFLYPRQKNQLPTSFPRVRGDVPVIEPVVMPVLKFSPRARGCSGKVDPVRPILLVFPACAGMFRMMFMSGGRLSGFPRVRGDVPETPRNRARGARFSPRARGCS